MADQVAMDHTNQKTCAKLTLAEEVKHAELYLTEAIAERTLQFKADPYRCSRSDIKQQWRCRYLELRERRDYLRAQAIAALTPAELELADQRLAAESQQRDREHAELNACRRDPTSPMFDGTWNL